MLFVRNSKGGAVRRSLGVLDLVDVIVERHPEKVLAEALQEVASNVSTVL